jgi:hypothetical protein
VSVSSSSFRGDTKYRTTLCNCTSENLEIPGLVLTHHPGMMRAEKMAHRSPDERSDIRERSWGRPGCRYAHPGYGTSDLNVKQPIPIRHCERSEAIHSRQEERWIASSLPLPCANALRFSQAMTSGYTCAFSRRGARPSRCKVRSPLEERGRREHRVRSRHPQSRVRNGESTRA